MTQTFAEFFNQKVLIDRLPFGVDFQLSTIKSNVTENVLGFDLKVKKSLTSVEQWFFETIEELNDSRSSEVTITLRRLIIDLKNELEIPTYKEASEAFFNPKEEIVEDIRYQEYNTKNVAEIKRLAEINRLTENPRAINWMKVTFFMKTRYNLEWSLGDTVQFTDEELDTMIAFIAKEANKGVEPEINTEVKEVTTEAEGKPTPTLELTGA